MCYIDFIINYKELYFLLILESLEMNNLSSFLWLLITNKFRIFPTQICIFTCTVLYDQLSFLLRCLGLFLIRNRWLLQIIKKAVSYFNPIQTGGGGLLRPYQTLKLNNFKTVKAMTTKFSDFS